MNACCDANELRSSLSHADAHCADHSHETWWKVYVWEWDPPRGSWHRPSTEMSPVQTQEGVNGDVLWHTGTDVWGQCGHRPVRSEAEIAPLWTGVNYGTKGVRQDYLSQSTKSCRRQRGQCCFYDLETHRREDAGCDYHICLVSWSLCSV